MNLKDQLVRITKANGVQLGFKNGNYI